jgi:hypothetical protein
MKRLDVWLTILATSLAAGCAHTLIMKPFEITVVDAETGQPIEGVNVSANWRLDQALLHGHKFRDIVEVMETVTDANGRAAFPGFTKSHPHMNELEEESPKVVIFKAGYEYRRLINDCPEDDAICKLDGHGFAYAGQKIKLYRLTEKPAENAWNRFDPYPNLMGQLNATMASCRWKKIPKMTMASVLEGERIKKEGKWSAGSLLTRDNFSSNADGCGDFALLEELSK